MLAQESDHTTISTPHRVLDQRRRQLSNNLLLLNIKQHHARRATQQQTRRSTVEDIVNDELRRTFDRLGDGIFEISNFDRLGSFVEDGESISGDEEC